MGKDTALVGALLRYHADDLFRRGEDADAAAARRKRAFSERRAKISARDDSAFEVASYYVEFVADVAEMAFILAWYAVELISGSLELSAGSMLFSVYAQQAHARLRARFAVHREWAAMRRDLDARSLFQPASDDTIRTYDDICVICHDDFKVSETKKLRGSTPVKLPRCTHLIHKSCLQVCLKHAHSTFKPMTCPICREPCRRPGPKDPPRPPPRDPDPAPAPDPAPVPDPVPDPDPAPPLPEGGVREEAMMFI